MTSEIPKGLIGWLEPRCDSQFSITECKWPVDDLPKAYILCSSPLNLLKFENHDYNPRNPSEKKVDNLKSSIQTMGLFSPLTCAFLEDSEEQVLLVDGRHRFDALKKIRTDYPEWADQAYIDLKIYFSLQRSDLHAMATYLNKTRQKLKKGEYYKAIVKIYDERNEELIFQTKKTPSERDVISSIQGQEFPNKYIDFTIGRIVGLTAFNEEDEGAWYPFVGLGQREKIFMDKHPILKEELGLADQKSIYKPLTAGSFHDFIKPLCHDKSYEDWGKRRFVEIGNISKLGSVFSSIFFRKELFDIPANKQYTATTVGCKYWCIVSLGYIIKELEHYIVDYSQYSQKYSTMGYDNIDWNEVEGIFKVYKSTMEKQSEYVQEFVEKKRNNAPLVEQEEALKNAWSYYTTKEKVINPLRREFYEEDYEFE